MTDSDWGAKIRALRRQRGYSLDELARRTGYSKATLSYIENGKRQLKIVQILTIAGALGVHMREIIYPCKSRLSA